MSRKDKLRQQLLEQTLGKNAKNRSFSSIGDDLNNILQMQSEQIKELSTYVDPKTLDKMRKNMEKNKSEKAMEKLYDIAIKALKK